MTRFTPAPSPEMYVSQFTGFTLNRYLYKQSRHFSQNVFYLITVKHLSTNFKLNFCVPCRSFWNSLQCFINKIDLLGCCLHFLSVLPVKASAVSLETKLLLLQGAKTNSNYIFLTQVVNNN